MNLRLLFFHKRLLTEFASQTSRVKPDNDIGASAIMTNHILVIVGLDPTILCSVIADRVFYTNGAVLMRGNDIKCKNKKIPGCPRILVCNGSALIFIPVARSVCLLPSMCIRLCLQRDRQCAQGILQSSMC